MNKYIKDRIATATRQQLRLKMEGKNPRSFWNAISLLEGKNIRENIKLEINGTIIHDEKILVEEFADFFQNKVTTLSNDQGKNDYSIGNSPLNITPAEVKAAVKNMKSKLCAGEDMVPMKVARDIVRKFPDYFCDFFNFCSMKGIPPRWKLAIITPLFKSGDREKVTQYRPISNLDSLSKIYERIILHRLNLEGELDGSYQHGFKESRSTVTAMLELQDFVSSSLDSGNIVGTYSLDLSAAFDLLRPDIFHDQMKDILPNNLLQTLMDFLSGRLFKVQIGNQRSTSRNLKVGCVQGSILGPRLFTLYMSRLPEIFKDEHIISFADDSYVSIAGKSLDSIKAKLETTMVKHNEFLKRIGMVTNVSKTELIFFSRKPIMDQCSLSVNGTIVNHKPTMKVLGLTFDSHLNWNAHLDKIKQKARFSLHKMKFLRKYLDQSQMKKVITSHFFGTIYYGAPIWMTEVSSSRVWNTLNVLHYKALRTVCSDFRKLKSRRELDTIVKRARPHEWMKYINIKTAVQLVLLKEKGPPIVKKLTQNLYRNDRSGLISFMDTSRLKIGKHSLQNRLKCASEFKRDWITGITKDELRIELKKHFIK